MTARLTCALSVWLIAMHSSLSINTSRVSFPFVSKCMSISHHWQAFVRDLSSNGSYFYFALCLWLPIICLFFATFFLSLFPFFIMWAKWRNSVVIILSICITLIILEYVVLIVWGTFACLRWMCHVA